MKKITNISDGPRGAWVKVGEGRELKMVEAGETAEGDFIDVNDEWFASPAKAKAAAQEQERSEG